MARDAPFKALRHNDVWTRVVACFPHASHWLDGEPITDVIAMAGVLDRLCRIVVDGRPIVTGLVSVGDAWACTNPTAGRGISLVLAHAVVLRDALRENAGYPAGLVARFDEVTEAALTPWFRGQYDRDRQRAADTQAVLGGRPMPPPGPAQAKQMAFSAAVGGDPEVARGWFDTLSRAHRDWLLGWVESLPIAQLVGGAGTGAALVAEADNLTGAGSMPWRLKISQTLEGASWTPRPGSSPCTRRLPQEGFSFPRRSTRPGCCVWPSRSGRAGAGIDHGIILPWR